MQIHFLAAGITDRPNYPFTKLIRGHFFRRGVLLRIIAQNAVCSSLEARRRLPIERPVSEHASVNGVGRMFQRINIASP